MFEVISKEFRELLYSPKFIIIAIACTVLIFISLYNGHAAYRAEMDQIAVDRQVALEELRASESFGSLFRIRLFREPSKLAIFDTGITGVFGRSSGASSYSGGFRMGESRSSDNPILAVFGELDLTFIVTTILSLFALLFSYNAISGERENGTLRMLAANTVSRTSIVVSKLIGGFIPLALIFLLPFIAGMVALMLLTDVQFTAQEWLRIGFMAGSHILFLLVFYCIGLAMSALSRKSFMSFLLCLSVWVLSVGVLPRGAANLATAIKPVMSQSDLWKEMSSVYRQTRGGNYRFLKQYFDDKNVKKENQRDEIPKARDYAGKKEKEERTNLLKPYWNKFFRQHREQTSTVLTFAHLSPVSCAQVTQHRLADSGPYLYFHFKDAKDSYEKVLNEYLDPKIKNEREERQKRRMETAKNPAVKFNESGRLVVVRRDIESEEEQKKLDITGFPEFRYAPPPFEEIAGDVFTGMGVLAGYAIFFFAVAYVAFLRYDVR